MVLSTVLNPSRSAPTSSGAFKCDVCGHTYKHSRSLRKHERFECGKEPQFVCVYCPYKAKLRGNLRKHIMVKHREEWTSGAAKIYVQKTKKKAPGEIPSRFRCDTCGKSYKLKSSIREHKKYECMKEPQFGCPACPYRAKLKGNLKKHMLSKHCLGIDKYFS
ncbi:unnamed protein product [Phyllotreta striolata]|uniref:C2H2-type domain-containing protein n=1 Tax=Phyllotreta striolata TaxID=444603 RepID=A0A9N9XTK6_PHYSR|nr:unnamed protein product [Phyllotreta striolata]